jgi:hypothetical protein
MKKIGRWLGIGFALLLLAGFMFTVALEVGSAAGLLDKEKVQDFFCPAYGPNSPIHERICWGETRQDVSLTAYFHKPFLVFGASLVFLGVGVILLAVLVWVLYVATRPHPIEWVRDQWRKA